MRKIEGFVSFTTASQNGDILTCSGRTGAALRLFIEAGVIQLTDGKTTLQSSYTYSDSRKHHVYFKRHDTNMILAVDDNDYKSRGDLKPLSTAKKESVEVTIGGDFSGCVATPYFIGAGNDMTSAGSLLNMRCSTRSSSTCKNKPDFNQCSIRPAQSILMRTISPDGRNGRRVGRQRKKNRSGKNRKHKRRRNKKQGRRRGGKKARIMENRFKRRTRRWFNMLH